MRIPALVGGLAASAALVISAAWPHGLTAQAPRSLPLDPSRERDASVTPAYEGWYENADGSFSLLLGYYNRNSKEALDIRIGPENRIEPGGPDRGQPTHFETGRQWGVFVIKVPKDFGSKAVTWTIVSNGETHSVPFTLNKGYVISPFKEAGMGNRPPVFSFSRDGAKVTGPPAGIAATLTGSVNAPVSLSVWVEDPKETVKSTGGSGAPQRGVASPAVATVSFHKARGPGRAIFAPASVPVAKQGDMATTAATFDAPGEYLLRVQGNDESGDGGRGFQCCWTNALVSVVVK
jgi:hypothetical protein